MFRFNQESIMEQLGNLVISLVLLDPAPKGCHPDDLFSRRSRRVSLLRMYQVSKEEAYKTATMFLADNRLDNSDHYHTEVVWTYTEKIYM